MIKTMEQWLTGKRLLIILTTAAAVWFSFTAVMTVLRYRQLCGMYGDHYGGSHRNCVPAAEMRDACCRMSRIFIIQKMLGGGISP